ncbi:MAG: radical SAM protein, partial [Desulfovibrionaceae bacterium]|nr:radical SAM protein [Desulfovibrionaceae bacterium]
VVRGINDVMVGDLLRYAVRQGRHVRGVHFQPVASFGRFPWEMATAPRLTLPELMVALEEQSNALVRAAHFHAPSCEHPLCSFSAVYGRAGEGLSPSPLGSTCCSGGNSLAQNVPSCVDNAEGSRISKAFTAAHWASPRQERAVGDAFSRFLSTAGADNRFTVSAMAFQDAYSLDIERVRGCCIHVVTSDRRLIPFCAYNLTSLGGTALYRG